MDRVATITNGWLVVIYRVPSTPSTSRVTVWKRLKEVGALLLQQSVYILPNLPQVREATNQLKEQIKGFGGECKLLEILSMGKGQEEELIAGFSKNREEEYIEVIEACEELSHEIDSESEAGEFHYADLEENEKHLQRVGELLDSVKNRDYFYSPLQARAISLTKECREKFEKFSQAVFSLEGIVTENKGKSLVAGVKYKQKQAYSKNELIAKIGEIVNSLNDGKLEVSGKEVGDLSDSAILEWDYKERRVGRSLEIKIEWTPS